MTDTSRDPVGEEPATIPPASSQPPVESALGPDGGDAIHVASPSVEGSPAEDCPCAPDSGPMTDPAATEGDDAHDEYGDLASDADLAAGKQGVVGSIPISSTRSSPFRSSGAWRQRGEAATTPTAGTSATMPP